MLKKLLLCIVCALLLLSITFVADYRKAQACSCASPRAMDEIMQGEDEVFTATVKGISKPGGRLLSSMDPIEVRMIVNKVWKGNIAAAVVVKTAQSSASCGYDGFKEGGSYLVIAEETPNGLYTGLCSGTKSLASAGKELAYLGEGYAPGPAAAEPVESKHDIQVRQGENSGYGHYILLAAAVMLAAVLWAAVILSRMKG
ncbi:hypothetical protein [Paenibacillus tarimensis]|uniref:hypothetical protein n=1 Tax=Paenibacillus tarimensis TaxID=416012 RepID=UPI001F15BC0D|nr:hypothetical protein [Paenibacillus tarimensis]MCF2942885.1 hypothetical protein [Paenibacillus tarimensis]